MQVNMSLLVVSLQTPNEVKHVRRKMFCMPVHIRTIHRKEMHAIDCCAYDDGASCFVHITLVDI